MSTMINASSSAWPRIPVEHMPNENASPAMIWLPCSGNDVSSFDIPPRAVWFNDVAVYRCITSATHPNIPNTSTTAYLNVPVRGFESVSFDQVLNEDGSDLDSLTAAYFIW